MLPFLKKKNQPVAGLIIKTRKSDEKPEQEESGAEIHAKDLLLAIENKDAKGVVEALRAVIDNLGSEAPADSFDAQNQLAALDGE